MFRTTALRSASRAAAAAALRPVARSTSMFAAAAPRAVAAPVAVRAQSFVPVRMYSAGGGLKKEEVEGRIMSLLQGFDKVCAHLGSVMSRAMEPRSVAPVCLVE